MLNAYYANNTTDTKDSPEKLHSTLSRAIIKRMNELEMKIRRMKEVKMALINFYCAT